MKNLLEFILTEAERALDGAKRYRIDMDALPEKDPRRSLYLQGITELLCVANRLAHTLNILAAK